MTKEKLIRGFKICVIIVLVFCITLVSLVHWKSDWIISKVLSNVQGQLSDTLVYQSVHMDAFSHFPCVAVQLDQISLGSGRHPLIKHGNADVVIRLLPLFRNNIDIDRIQVEHAEIHIAHSRNKWSYEVLKKTEAGAESKSWKTLVHQIELNQSIIIFSDPETALQFQLTLGHASFVGQIDPDRLDINMDADAVLDSLVSTDYSLPESFPVNLKGRYVFDFKNETQEYHDWILESNSISMQANGKIVTNENDEIIEMKGSWSAAKMDEIRKWLPKKVRATWKDYSFWGESEGQFEIQGTSSKTKSPAIVLEGILKGGGFKSVSSKQEIKNIDLRFEYHSHNGKYNQQSTLYLLANKKTVLGDDLKGEVMIVNLEKPVVDLSLKGNMPATLLNLASIPGLSVEGGEFDIHEFSIQQFRATDQPVQQLLKKGIIQFHSKEFKSTYLNNPIEWNNAKFTSSSSAMKFDFDVLTWSKATGKEIDGNLTLEGDEIQFAFKGSLSEGHVESQGTLTTLSPRPVFDATWIVKDINIEDLLASFSNFNQTFITSENLSGRATVWAVTTIPMDDKWNIREKEVTSKCALEIHSGRLKNLKTLEDFSDYVHIEDLQDIRFSDLRNYLKIEGGKVYLPVVFIQSSAMNLSISGVHGFDQKITYFLKLNAGQAVANKLRKTDFKKDLKAARKSGWINMYFVLEGSTSNVLYQQNRNAVINGFEQSTQLKESLRKELVDRFGYDVYWLEPNEWEDIPEYK
ncbi:MAG TPA: AsmA-like C-terminal region-containing protein [Saprospiraceae bacterium]|nr:AsmA-like C-terminal region-containing protein [Saprospiraceae bacterium]